MCKHTRSAYSTESVRSGSRIRGIETNNETISIPPIIKSIPPIDIFDYRIGNTIIVTVIDHISIPNTIRERQHRVRTACVESKQFRRRWTIFTSGIIGRAGFGSAFRISIRNRGPVNSVRASHLKFGRVVEKSV